MEKQFWLDSHAHLSDEKYVGRLDEIMEHCKQNQVNKIVTICLSFEELERAFCIKEKYPQVDIAMGFFPTDYFMFTEENYKKLEEVAKDERIVAIGEIGLDYYWEKAQENRKIQQVNMLRQIEIAKKVNKPILIHSRDAAQDTLNIVKETGHRGVLHCYSYSVEMAMEFIKIGYTISLAGPVTFKNAKEPKEVAKTIPLNYMLIETDSPYLTPEPHRGMENEPGYVKHVGEYICELRGISHSELQKIVQENYKKIVGK